VCVCVGVCVNEYGEGIRVHIGGWVRWEKSSTRGIGSMSQLRTRAQQHLPSLVASEIAQQLFIQNLKSKHRDVHYLMVVFQQNLSRERERERERRVESKSREKERERERERERRGGFGEARVTRCKLLQRGDEQRGKHLPESSGPQQEESENEATPRTNSAMTYGYTTTGLQSFMQGEGRLETERE
jgi:hypothetical protein